jgi:hypothetical protein
MDAATIQALVQGLGPFGAVIVLAAYAIWSKPKPGTLASPVTPEYERGMIAAMTKAANSLEACADALDKIERHVTVLLDRSRNNPH